jgi:hypothetical protein
VGRTAGAPPAHVIPRGGRLDRFTIIMVKTSLAWLLSGFVLGGLMMVDRVVPGSWRAWLLPTHGHMLFVGWFVQFAIGIAYWLLPRKRRPEMPVGYRENLAFIGWGMLNAGLLLRVVGEPMERVGDAGTVSISILSISAVLQVAAILMFIAQLWPRIYGKGKLGTPAAQSGGKK